MRHGTDTSNWVVVKTLRLLHDPLWEGHLGLILAVVGAGQLIPEAKVDEENVGGWFCG